MTRFDHEPRHGESYSERLGDERHDGFALTHARWHSCYGEYPGSNETGVHRRGRNFEIIQHGWSDWQEAGCVIATCVRKGWSIERIATFMDRLQERRRPRPRFA